jgi:gas vesicle protein
LGLAVLNSTIEGLSGYEANDLDVIYHTDPTRDYNILLKDVLANPDINNALSDVFPEIKEKINKDPTILVDIRERLRSDIENAAKDADTTKSSQLEALILKMEASAKTSNFIIDKDKKLEKLVKDFRMLLDAVMKDTTVSDLFKNNSPLLDEIKLKLNKNPEMLERVEERLAADIEKIEDKVVAKQLVDAINNVVSKTEYTRQLELSGKLGGVTYNEPGYFRFGPSNYVPNYEDSVYLSRLTGLSYAMPVVDSGSQLSGFCAFNKSNPGQTETECNKLNKNTCASTSCCVLLGGSKCVSGNESGPTMKSNFGDIYIKNKDHYYYQGKCYGNCP